MKKSELKQIIREIIAEQKLNEAVKIDHSQYRISHGKDASGTGSWAFAKEKSTDIRNGKEGTDFIFIRGQKPLSAAAKEAAEKLGVNTVYVMP